MARKQTIFIPNDKSWTSVIPGLSSFVENGSLKNNDYVRFGFAYLFVNLGNTWTHIFMTFLPTLLPLQNLKNGTNIF